MWTPLRVSILNLLAHYHGCNVSIKTYYIWHRTSGCSDRPTFFCDALKHDINSCVVPLPSLDQKKEPSQLDFLSVISWIKIENLILCRLSAVSFVSNRSEFRRMLCAHISTSKLRTSCLLLPILSLCWNLY